MKNTTQQRIPERLVALVLLLLALTQAAWAEVRPGAVHLWDTVTPLRANSDLSQRQAWRPIAPAASGHLQGDLVVEADGLVTAFASRLREVRVGSGTGPRGDVAAIRPAGLAEAPDALAPAVFAERDGVVMVEADFRAGADDLPIRFTFRGDRVVAVRPEGKTRGLTLSAPIDLALVPSFVGDDLIFDPRDYPSAKMISLPSEHFALGLLKGENSMLAMTWQEETPAVRLELGADGAGRKSIRAVGFVGGKGISLAVLDAPGIWHREVLKPFFLERDAAIAWRPPFPATWLTQLYEDEVKTTYEFREAREETWRGGVGDYIYPTWFSGGKPMLSLGKKILPEGEAIIYFLERNDGTPERAVSPTEIAKSTLTGDILARVLDLEGREIRPDERPNAAIGAATCAVTDALKEIFDQGQEVEKQAIVEGGVKDMYFYMGVMFERNGRYYPFAKDMIAYLEAQEKERPELAPFTREMQSIAAEIVTAYDDARDTCKDMNYAHELGQKTVALAAERRPGNPQRMVELKQDWVSMGGAVERLARQEHTLTRKLFQQAGYRAAVRPEALPLAEEIRRRAKKCLANPEGYEIWANY